MKDEFELAVLAALTVLDKTEHNSTPSEVESRLIPVRANFKGVSFELLWETESYDSSYHYDIVLRSTEDSRHVSMSASSNDMLPWPLRGVRKWSDADLVQVNGQVLKFSEAVAFLEIALDQESIPKRVVELAVMREAVNRMNVTYSADETQEAVDALRRFYHLYDPAEYQAWLDQRGMSQTAFENCAVQNLVYRQLKRRVAAKLPVEVIGDLADKITLWTISAQSSQLIDDIAALVRGGDRKEISSKIIEMAGDGVMSLNIRTDIRVHFSKQLIERLRGVGQSAIVARNDSVHLMFIMNIVRCDDVSSLPHEVHEDLALQIWLEQKRRTAVVTWFWGKNRETTESS